MHTLSPAARFAGAALAAALALPALAQPGTRADAQMGEPAEPPAEVTRPARQAQASLKLQYRHYDNEDLDDGGGVSASRVSADTEIQFPLGDASSFTLGLGVEHSDYDFGNTTIVPDTGDPVDRVITLNASGSLLTPFADRKMAWLVGGGVRSSAELHASFEDALTWRALTGVMYNPDPRISLGAGVLVATQLEDDPLIIPFPIIRYRIDDRWTIATEGPKLQVTYDHDGSISFGSYLGWENRSFRLESNTGLSSEGVINENRLPLGIFGAYSPNPGVEFRVDLFSSLYTKYEARADDESELGEDEADPAVGIGFTVNFRF